MQSKLVFYISKTISFWQKGFKWVLAAGVLCFFALTLTTPINLSTADLGRHIVNGRIFFESGQVLATNYYSFTQPDFPTLTTHWASGVIFFLIYKFFGFYGTQFFYILLYVIALGLMFVLAARFSNFWLALFASVLGLPLLASRAEVRPEIFTYLFISVFLYALYRFKLLKVQNDDSTAQKTLFQKIVLLFSQRWLWLLPLVQVVWVNTHILFPFGPLFVGIFFADSWLNDSRSATTRTYWRLLWVTSLACLLNPWGVLGALSPVLVMKEYGYMLAEMQSVTFMLKRGWNPYYHHLQVLVGLVGVGSLLMLFLRKFIEVRILLALGLLSGVFGWQMVRNLPVFGLVFIPVFAVFLHEIIKKLPKLFAKILQAISVLAVMGVLGWVYFVGAAYCYYLPDTTISSLGLAKNVNASADFIKANKVKGPIFNNYDVGGYLIYHLYPQEKVFVDNRPEAYSVPFFKELYVPMQEQEVLWRASDAKFKFNVIIFNRNDMTPWAQPFLIERIKDSGWAPVFVDDYVLILLKRNEQNARIIRFFELPRELFIITK